MFFFFFSKTALSPVLLETIHSNIRFEYLHFTSTWLHSYGGPGKGQTSEKMVTYEWHDTACYIVTPNHLLLFLFRNLLSPNLHGGSFPVWSIHIYVFTLSCVHMHLFIQTHVGCKVCHSQAMYQIGWIHYEIWMQFTVGSILVDLEANSSISWPGLIQCWWHRGGTSLYSWSPMMLHSFF